MTTIVYHNNKLYADTFGTVKKIYPDGDERNHKCSKCHHEHEYLSVRHVEKIYVVKENFKSHFHNDPIVAVGGAGVSRHIDGYVAAMYNTEDFEGFVKNSLGLFTAQNSPTCTLILVCRDNVYVVNLSKSSSTNLSVAKYGRDSVVAIGNGMDAALTAIKVYGEKPDYAIAVAAHITTGTGGYIDVIDLKVDKPTIQRGEMPKLRTKKEKKEDPSKGRRCQVKGAGSGAKTA